VVDLQFRAATLDDANFSADLQTALFPARPTDPVIERYWWEQPDDVFVSRRWIVKRDGHDIGIAGFDHPAWGLLQVPHGEIYGDVRMLAEDTGLMHPIAKVLWRILKIDGPASRFRSEPARHAAVTVA